MQASNMPAQKTVYLLYNETSAYSVLLATYCELLLQLRNLIIVYKC